MHRKRPTRPMRFGRKSRSPARTASVGRRCGWRQSRCTRYGTWPSRGAPEMLPSNTRRHPWGWVRGRSMLGFRTLALVVVLLLVLASPSRLDLDPRPCPSTSSLSSSRRPRPRASPSTLALGLCLLACRTGSQTRASSPARSGVIPIMPLSSWTRRSSTTARHGAEAAMDTQEPKPTWVFKPCRTTSRRSTT